MTIITETVINQFHKGGRNDGTGYYKIIERMRAGIKMGTASIGEVLEKTTNEKLKKLLETCKEGHEKLKEEIQNKLEQCHDTGKDPNPMAQGMSWMKTNVKLAMDESDATIADLITDGCNMGVKSLSRYLNQYQAADEETKDIAKKLIKQEEELSIHMRSFL